MLKVNLWKLYITWNMSFTDYCSKHQPSVPPEPPDEVLQEYTETLYSAKKQTTFSNTLIQDIPTFNGSDSANLEDWLIDIETTADLTYKSRTKLAQAKSKGLTPHPDNGSSCPR